MHSEKSIKSYKVFLVGNPNCGKTTLFNALTSSKQRVGNFSGVTVEEKSSNFSISGQDFQLIDLPGVYSLSELPCSVALDEKITYQNLKSQKADFIINVLDCANIERNLYLTLQLIEMGLPIIVVLNRMDCAQRRGKKVSIESLAKCLGCPVVGVVANKGKGLDSLKKILVEQGPLLNTKFHCISYDNTLDQAINNVINTVQINNTEKSISRFEAIQLLEGINIRPLNKYQLNKIKMLEKEIVNEKQHEVDIIIAQARYRVIESIIESAIVNQNESKAFNNNYSRTLDKIILNRFLSLPLFFLVMYCMFFFAINVGGVFQDFFDISSKAIFIDSLAHYLLKIGAPNWLIAAVPLGLGKGINTILTFVPVIGAMFFALTFLEDSGYMARAAFVMDRVMCLLGLPGKSFVPMIIGLGCNVPAILGTRTLENKRERILTVTMSPFMTCGARLAIFTVFVTAFFPSGGQNIVFALYMVGVLMAILTGLVLKKTILKGKPSPLVLELPVYHIPHFRSIMLHCGYRIRKFIFNCTKAVLPICMIIGILNNTTFEPKLANQDIPPKSALSVVGQILTPVFSPMGIKQDNWPATVALISGVASKEVVIGTLNTLYAQEMGIDVEDNATFSLKGSIRLALYSIWENITLLKGAILNPFVFSTRGNNLQPSIYGVMNVKFGGPIGAFAYLLFVLLYVPCISATAAMIKEVDKRWAMFSVLWTTSVAYIVAVMFFQVATFFVHPASSAMWCGMLLSFVIMFYAFLRYLGNYKSRTKLPTPIVLS